MAEPDHRVDPQRVEAARGSGLPASEADDLAGLLTLVADPMRARLLAALLAVDEMCVGDLALAIDANEDAVSYGLRLLRTAGLVRRRSAGRMRYYRLPHGPTRTALASLLSHMRQLGALHPETSAEDVDDTSDAFRPIALHRDGT